jgi:hypothetical protein
MSRDRQKQVATTLNCMGWVAVDENNEMKEGIYIGKPITMRLRKGTNRIVIDVDGVIRDYSSVEASI